MNTKVQRWINTGKLTVTDTCWVWSGCKNTDGYPKICYKGNANSKGHRVIYSMYNPTEDIAGKSIRHKCDNPLCMNPVHLESGSNEDNVNDRYVRGRSHNAVGQQETYSILSMRSLGHTYKEIGTQLGIKPKRVEYILNKQAIIAGG